MKIGILGGTFDPIHQGHLAVAEEVRARLELPEIIFVPTGRPWLRVNKPVSAVEHRVEMVRRAIAARPYFKLSTMEVERPGRTYTVDTIAEFREKYGAEAELFFILSRGTFAELHLWKEPSRLIKMCRFVVVPRPDMPDPDMEKLEAKIPGLAAQVIFVDKPEIDISATKIRDRLACGLSISQLVPEPVDRYIEEHRLYKTL